MKRSVWPRARKYSQRARISPSFTPRWTTQLILIGKPAPPRRRCPPARGPTLKPRPFMRPAVGLVERVDRDVEPVEAGGAKRGRLLSEEPAVGRERDVGHAQVLA